MVEYNKFGRVQGNVLNQLTWFSIANTSVVVREVRPGRT